MAEKKTTARKKTTVRSKTTTSGTKSKGFTDAERAAMKERAKELKAEERARLNRAAGEEALLDQISQMPKADRDLARRIHEIVSATAPSLWPKTWYGMPAYASDGKIVCFFQPASKFGARYATFGFNDTAELDDGALWPTSFALTKLGPAEEKKIKALVKKAVG